MGQVRRAMRSNLHVEGSCGDLLLDPPDTEKKRASWQLLAPSQRAAVAFSLRAGYLADLERAVRSKKISDFAFFPRGRLRDGRAQVDADAVRFVDKRTLNA